MRLVLGARATAETEAEAPLMYRVNVRSQKPHMKCHTPPEKAVLRPMHASVADTLTAARGCVLLVLDDPKAMQIDK